MKGTKRALKGLMMQLTNGTVNRPQIFSFDLNPQNSALKLSKALNSNGKVAIY